MTGAFIKYTPCVKDYVNMLNAKKKSTTRITTYRKQLTFEADYYTCICLDFVLANKVHQITFIGFSILGMKNNQ